MGSHPVGETNSCLADGTTVSSDDFLRNLLSGKELLYFVGEQAYNTKLNASQP